VKLPRASGRETLRGRPARAASGRLGRWRPRSPPGLRAPRQRCCALRRTPTTDIGRSMHSAQRVALVVLLAGAVACSSEVRATNLVAPERAQAAWGGPWIRRALRSRRCGDLGGPGRVGRSGALNGVASSVHPPQRLALHAPRVTRGVEDEDAPVAPHEGAGHVVPAAHAGPVGQPHRVARVALPVP
jgi:hypothetical protein